MSCRIGFENKLLRKRLVPPDTFPANVLDFTGEVMCIVCRKRLVPPEIFPANVLGFTGNVMCSVMITYSDECRIGGEC